MILLQGTAELGGDDQVVEPGLFLRVPVAQCVVARIGELLTEFHRGIDTLEILDSLSVDVVVQHFVEDRAAVFGAFRTTDGATTWI